MAGHRLLIFAKAPVPGLVKSCLIPALGAGGAAALHAALARHTLQTAQASGGTVDLWCYPDPAHPFFAACARTFPIVLKTQQGGDLGVRMYRAATAGPAGMPVLLIGTDCPELAVADLKAAHRALVTGHDAVIGPALDGGYYLLGLRHPRAELFMDMPWGTDEVLARTRERMGGLGWRCRELPVRRDIDRPSDLPFLSRHLMPEASPPAPRMNAEGKA